MVKTNITSFYIVLSIFLTPFCDKYFVIFVVTSFIFAVEFIQINSYFLDVPAMSSII